MSKEWFSPAEFAAFRLPFMPTTKARINQMADRDGWRRPDLEWPANPAGVWRRREVAAAAMSTGWRCWTARHRRR
ncbi:hypothetical protein V6L77_00840 [Pannonibacter sp. Pt2-lr]